MRAEGWPRSATPTNDPRLMPSSLAFRIARCDWTRVARKISRLSKVLWKKYMHGRERAHHERDNNRLVRPFDWGLKYIFDHVNGDDPRHMLRNFSRQAMQHSEDFYHLPEIHDFSLSGDQLTWSSAITTPDAVNNIACARYFPAEPKRSRPRSAVVVLPQWNAQPDSHV